MKWGTGVVKIVQALGRAIGQYVFISYRKSERCGKSVNPE